jgi:hypothetical protein
VSNTGRSACCSSFAASLKEEQQVWASFIKQHGITGE